VHDAAVTRAGQVRHRQPHPLLVGGPDEIPFSFQYDLDVRYAVGRLDFDSPSEYAVYAESVVAAEKAWNGSPSTAERRMSFFCPNKPDKASRRMRNELVGGLISRFDAAPLRGWSPQALLDDDATREGLCDLLGGDGTPDFLFTACHGLVFRGDSRQREKQGALLCQTDAPSLDASVSAEEISDQASVHGLIAFHFACFGAGTPELDLNEGGDRKAIREAEKPFTARLPQRLLAHPNGGALAVIGHVSRAWTFSFSGFGKNPQINTFEDVIRRILRGERVGQALELFNLSFAEKAAHLMTLQELEEIAPSNGQRQGQFAVAYCVAKDARNYVVLGDPAVRLEPSQPAVATPI